jgi:hypothetical protein
MEYSDFYATINTTQSSYYSLSSTIFILELITFLHRNRPSKGNSKRINPELIVKLRTLLSEFELEDRVDFDFKTVALLETLRLSEYLVNQIEPKQCKSILKNIKTLPPPAPPAPPPPSIILPTKRRMPKALVEQQHQDNSFVDEIKLGRTLRVISLKRNPSGTPVKTKTFSKEDFFFDQIKKKFSVGNLDKSELEFEDWQ